MKFKFRYYAIVWAVLVVIFNAVVFVTPNEAAGMSKFGGAFWAGYIFIMLTFIGHLAVAWFSLKDTDAARVFYHIPVVSINCVTLIVMIAAGTICMAVPYLPNWMGILICIVILAVSIIVMVQAQAAASIAGGIDTKVKNQTFFIKSLTVDLDSLMAKAPTPEITDAVKEVYEVVRYSDPMSNDALAGIESQITLKVSELTEAVEKSDSDMVSKAAKEAVILLNDRNKKCRLLK